MSDLTHSSVFPRAGQGPAPPPGMWALLVVDIAEFGDPARDDPARMRLRERLYALLDAALHGSGIGTAGAYMEDRGDGAIIVMPYDAAFTAGFEPMIARIRAGLYRHNRTSGDATRLRLRMAAHAGEIGTDPHGLVGTAVNQVFRMLDAGPLRRVMRVPETYLALLVSDQVFDDVVSGGEGASVPEDYAPVRVQVKETRMRAWLRVPGAAPAAYQAAAADGSWPPSTAGFHDIPTFVGRAELLGRLDEIAAGSGDRSRVAVLTGMPGAGKTAVAVRWATRAAERFPDGQVFARLDARAPHGTSSDDVLVQVLLSVGVAPAAIPPGSEERVRLWRTWTATRQVLLVLDDAADSQQVNPLLAHGPGCMTLITSRSTLETLVALEGAAVVLVDELPADDAVELVRAIIGAGRADREPDAVRSLVRWCSGMPLAIRIAAAKIAVRPQREVGAAVADLTGTPRLGALRAADSPAVGVIAVFDASYHGLTADARRALRLTGLIPGPDVTADTVGALLEVPEAEAVPLLEELEREHLVEAVGGLHYRVHELLRDYARVRLAAEETREDRDAAFRRLLAAYREAALLHRHRLGRPRPASGSEPGAEPARPQDGDPATRTAALAWFDREWPNLAAAARAAAEARWWDTAGVLADALFDFLDARRRIHENIALQRLALQGAEHQGADDLRVRSLLRLAMCEREIGAHTVAADRAEHACRLAVELGAPALEGEARRILGSIKWRVGQYDAALANARQAFRLAHASGDAHAEAAALSLQARVERRRGQNREAYDHSRAALEIWRRLGDEGNQAVALDGIAQALSSTPGHTADAIDEQRQALALFRRFGDIRGEADALDGMARILRRMKRPTEAVHYGEEARRIRHEIGDVHGEVESLDTLARIHRGLGTRNADREDLLMAHVYCEQGLRLARQAYDKISEAAMLSNHARTLLELGEATDAVTAAEAAVRIGATLDDPFGQARRLEDSALVLRAVGRAEEADDRTHQARRLIESIDEPDVPG